ncbi:Protein of unknown function [Alteribacillus persepolensis]|uniref:Uncharacterized protein n=1 Tax=Alteribacillus persepolensis TaxID=568899 RepID=A0A1G7ZP88_9BACI|nr:DUF4227 family protein [Alteribacillus persepolensis]SDH10523.1 Protein of unknown function [Alteribacillus persepolensis]
MEKWVMYSIETMKIFIVFIVCLFAFYYGILWLSDSYEADERLNQPEKNFEEVQGTLRLEGT